MLVNQLYYYSLGKTIRISKLSAVGKDSTCIPVISSSATEMDFGRKIW